MVRSLLWSFGPFRLDPTSGCLWRQDELLALRPKPLAVLAYLVTHAGEVVTKDALLDAVWPDTIVSDGALKDCVNQIRVALGETARDPRYIATVHRRGYRFMAPVTCEDSLSTLSDHPSFSRLPYETPSNLLSALSGSPSPMVGRQTEMAQLHQWWDTARHGRRQVVFIAGEAGIGKTTLVDSFISQVANDEALWLGYGQCIEQYGAGEPYLPLLEAVGRLGRGPGGNHIVASLHQFAPSWLLQLPSLSAAVDVETLQRRIGGVMPERMLRELMEAVETLTAERPLILILEDLHWSDTSTLEWLAYMGRRRESARLLVLGTYQPVEALVQMPPLRSMIQELRRHNGCVELAMACLSAGEVEAYLAQRFERSCLPDEFAQVLYDRTSGNPLFILNVVDEMVRQGVLREGETGWELLGGLKTVETAAPESLRQLIDRQLEQVDETDQKLLEIASVVGMAFSAAAVAAGIGQPAEDVESRCATLVRRGQFLRSLDTATWPDGTVAAGYGFIHALYREILYERVPAGRRVRLHQEIGIRLEVGYGKHAREIAAELAVHFIRGRDARRAVPYLRFAADNALQRSAPQEAIAHLTKGLEVLAGLPDTSTAAQYELGIQIDLGAAAMVAKGYGAPEVERAYDRARELCQQLDETPRLFRALGGLRRFYTNRGELQTAQELAAQMLSLAHRTRNPDFSIESHYSVGYTLFCLGTLTAAQTHLEQAITLADRLQSHAPASIFGFTGIDYRFACRSIVACSLWLRGYPDQARANAHETLSLSQERFHPFTMVYVLHWCSYVHQFCRNVSAVREQTETMTALARQHGFGLYEAQGMIQHGWALTQQGQGEQSIAEIARGLAVSQDRGSWQTRPYYLALLAEGYRATGQIEAGLRTLMQALTLMVKKRGSWYEAEIYRLKGELLRLQSTDDQTEAETSFHQAIEIAQNQHAKSLELRAATSLARLWQSQDKPQDAHDLLASVYNWFTEGFDTVDLQDAKALLNELSEKR